MRDGRSLPSVSANTPRTTQRKSVSVASQRLGSSTANPPPRKRGVRAAPAFKTLDLRPAASVEFILRLVCNVSSVVTQHPDVLGGEPVFAGTRVPAKSLFDHLEAGDSIEQFLEGFPSVKREQVIALLEDSKALVLAAR